MATAQRRGPSSTYLFLDMFPLLVIPVLAYNVVLLGGIIGADTFGAWLAEPVFAIRAFSGDSWRVSAGDLFMLVGLLMLFVEMIKSTRTDALSLINHALAALAFVVFLVEFLVMRGFTTSVFFALVAMEFIDVVAGYTISAVAAKRDFGSSGGIIGTN
jgi:hypothetical protein